MDDSNLYQRGGVWWARVQINGRDVRRSLSTAVKKDARLRLKQLLTQAEEARAAPIIPAAAKTWNDAVVRWSALQMSDLKPSSQTRYLVSLRAIDPFFSGRPITAITPVEISDYAVKRQEGGVSSSTVRRDLSVMARVMKVAKRAGWISANPVPEEKAEVKERRIVVKPVPTRHIVRVIRAAHTSFASPEHPGLPDLIRFLARVGCRQDEGASLEWSQVNLATRTITFTETKTGAPRVISITPRTASWLAKLPRLKRPRPGEPHYVFRDLEGKKLHAPAQRFRTAHARSGVPPFRCHDLRHTYGIRRLQADQRQDRRDDQPRGIFECARHMGHASTKTTEIYLAWLLRPSR